MSDKKLRTVKTGSGFWKLESAMDAKGQIIWCYDFDQNTNEITWQKNIQNGMTYSLRS